MDETTDRMKFHGKMTMEEASKADSRVLSVLLEFHVGGCQLCGFEYTDTIEKVAEDNGIALDVLLERLNTTCID